MCTEELNVRGLIPAEIQGNNFLKRRRVILIKRRVRESPTAADNRERGKYEEEKGVNEEGERGGGKQRLPS